MSTSDPSAGPLDPQILARLASEMFAALPQAAAPNPLPAAPLELSSETSPAMAPGAGMAPGMASAGSGLTSPAPAHLPGGGRSSSALTAPEERSGAWPATVSPAQSVPPMATPGLLGLAVPPVPESGIPALTQPLFPGSSQAAALASPFPPQGSPPAATARPSVGGVDLAAIEVPGDIYLRSLFPETVTAPAVASGRPLAGAVPSSLGPSFYFLEHARPAASTSTVPGFPGDPQRQDSRATAPTLDVELVRRDFPILQERVNGRPWSGSTTRPPPRSRRR